MRPTRAADDIPCAPGITGAGAVGDAEGNLGVPYVLVTVTIIDADGMTGAGSAGCRWPAVGQVTDAAARALREAALNFRPGVPVPVVSAQTKPRRKRGSETDLAEWFKRSSAAIDPKKLSV